MFLNSTPKEFDVSPIGLSQDQYLRNLKLLDYNVNYYGFLESKEYEDFYTSLEGKTLTQVMYESPYFGTFVSSAYAGLDRLYEAYKARLRADKETSSISPLLILAAAAAFFFAG